MFWSLIAKTLGFFVMVLTLFDFAQTPYHPDFLKASALTCMLYGYIAFCDYHNKEMARRYIEWYMQGCNDDDLYWY